MPDIKFETDTYAQRRRFQRAEMSATQRFIIKNSGGLVKSKQEANYALLGFIAVAAIVSLFLFSSGNPSEPPAGYKGNIPDSPEYRNPPTPQDFR